MKLVEALPGMPVKVTEQEVERLLESKLNLQFATVDERGYPNIHPMWFCYEVENGKLYVVTQKSSKKVQNVLRNPDKIYFSIDDENYPYKGVKGRGYAAISEDERKNMKIVEKIILKYLGTLEHPLAKMLIENVSNKAEVGIEITPHYFSAWDFGKAQ